MTNEQKFKTPEERVKAVGANCRMMAEVSFRYAINCGLTVGRFSA